MDLGLRSKNVWMEAFHCLIWPCKFLYFPFFGDSENTQMEFIDQIN